MKAYCVTCRKNTENLNSKIFKTKSGRLLMQSKCTDCGMKKSTFIKEQEAKGLLNNLGIKIIKCFNVKCFVLRCSKATYKNE